MGDIRIRGVIAIIVVIFFVVVSGFLVLCPILGFGDPDKDLLNYFISSFSGIIGVILGYYFKSGIDALKTNNN